MKTNAKQTTIKTLIALKADVYERATKRARELTRATGDLGKLSEQYASVHNRADRDAGKIAFVINLVRVRA